MYKKIKRVLDIICSLTALILLLPIIVIVALLVKINLGSPIIFKQKRIGENNKIFTLYKFRSMLPLSKNDENNDLNRITKFGIIIRKFSLDELPQLINILVGDMSFIGPRPLVKQYLPFFDKNEIKRHDVKPGLSGMAQINGRSNLNWEERFKLDVEYVENMSFLLDLSILVKTLFKIFKNNDVKVRGENSLEDFDVYRGGRNLR